MRYRKKPVVVEVWQFTKENYIEGVPQHIRQAIRDGVITLYSQHGGAVIGGSIETLEGVDTVSENDWIIQGVHGEFYPCKPDIYAETYEPDEPPQALRLENIADKGGLPIWFKPIGIDGPTWTKGYWVFLRTHKQASNGVTVGYVFADAHGEIDCDASDYGETWLAYPTEPGQES